MKRKRKSLSNRGRIIFWVLILMLLLFTRWMLAGFPAFSANGAAGRYLKENQIGDAAIRLDYSCQFGHRILFLEQDGYIYQLRTEQTAWPCWRVTGIKMTPASEDTYFVPLIGVSGWDVPDMAVNGSGSRAELELETEGRRIALKPAGSQDGWFFFRVDGKYMGSEPVSWLFSFESMADSLPPGSWRMNMVLTFRSYDENGRLLKEVSRSFP